MAITFIFCIILARLLYVQIAWGADLQELATDQWNREIPVVAARGIISDRNGVVLAGNRTTYSVFLRPNAVENAEYTATVLSGLFDLNPQKVLDKIQGGKVSEITVARQVGKESVEKLVSYDLAGVYYSRDNSRSYTYNDALCQVLGFTANDGSGLSGVEKYYDNILSGINGEITYTTDIIGVETENSVVVYKAAKNGDGIKLTIDMDIQIAAENAKIGRASCRERV